MAYLLDTHILLQTLAEPQRLSQSAKHALLEKSQPHYYSPASLWEITIKHANGKLELDVSMEEVFTHMRASGFIELPILETHLRQLAKLPFHHKEPFDRLLIAQAMSEDYIFISRDREIRKYQPLLKLLR